jgi:hypothetical protein
MTTMTLTPTRRTTWPVGLALGCVAGTALLVAGAWNVLIQEHVTVASPPTDAGPTVPPEQAMHTYYTWYAGTVAQSRVDTVLGMIGVVGLVLAADALRRGIGDRDALTRAGCTGLGAGGIVWVVGQLVAVGGHRAVGLMATHGNPIDGVNSIAFTVDTTSDAFSAAAFLLIGLAMVAIGVAPVRSGNARWAALTGLTGVVSLVVALGYVDGIDAVTTYVLGALAAVLTPVWLVWTGHLLDRGEVPAA